MHPKFTQNHSQTFKPTLTYRRKSHVCASVSRRYPYILHCHAILSVKREYCFIELPATLVAQASYSKTAELGSLHPKLREFSHAEQQNGKDPAPLECELKLDTYPTCEVASAGVLRQDSALPVTYSKNCWTLRSVRAGPGTHVGHEGKWPAESSAPRL